MIRKLDRRGWPSGEWDFEPDEAYWIDERTMMPCMIMRTSLGHLCGYAGVREGHRFYKRDSDEFRRSGPIVVHGGLTWSGPRGNDDFWWFGFDCGQMGDYSPCTEALNGLLNRCFTDRKTTMPARTYRNWKYVENEVRSLALQLRNIE